MTINETYFSDFFNTCIKLLQYFSNTLVILLILAHSNLDSWRSVVICDLYIDVIVRCANELLYVDDLVLMSETIEGLRNRFL